VPRPRVRPEIARSWHRSRQCGVRPDGDPTAGSAEYDPDAPLIRAAAPVLGRLADEMADADMTVILTDPHGLVLERRAGSSSLLRGLDRVLLTPGHVYSEEGVGTNGIGTAAEERRPAWVVGSEHYVDWLRWLSCAGVPIRNPITRRIEGILDLTCRLKDTNPLMVALVKEGVREIERRLYEASAESDRALLDRFIAVTRRSRRPVVALNERTVISNAAAARLLDPADHALLWRQVTEAPPARFGTARDLTLSTGSRTGVRLVACDEGAARGVVLEIDVERSGLSRPRHRSSEGLDVVLPGRSLAWTTLVKAVEELGDTRLPVLVSGEPGVGKLAVATWLHEKTQAGPLTVLDAELALVDGVQHWLEMARSRLAEPAGSLVLRHLRALDAPTARALGALIREGRARAAPRILATMRTGGREEGEVDGSLLEALPIVIHVPPLRERPEDIEDIVLALLRRHAAASAVRFSGQALQALMRADWPDNVRQLESVILGVLARRSRGEITLQDLPIEYRSLPARRLTRLEQAERRAIMEALAQTGGNKVRAAELLGVGRATLYRKLKELGIVTQADADNLLP
jgi:transcriptional regulator of acetoin/glycerol metabolism